MIRTVVTPVAERQARDPDWESTYAHDSDPGLRKSTDQEPKMPRKKPGRKKVTLPVLNPDAAGIDIGATEIYVAVPPDRDAESIRMFATFTQDLNHLADWLHYSSVESAR